MFIFLTISETVRLTVRHYNLKLTQFIKYLCVYFLFKNLNKRMYNNIELLLRNANICHY